jgi:hypothetical protein
MRRYLGRQRGLSRRARRVALVPAAALSIAGGLILAAPAMASVPPDHIVNVRTGGCLDSNLRGAVYLNPHCWPGDNYQRWHINGSEIVDDQTGRCLDANRHQGVFTNVCSAADPYETWKPKVSNGAEVTWQNKGEGGWVLDGNIHQGVFTQPYTNSGFQTDPYQKWSWGSLRAHGRPIPPPTWVAGDEAAQRA